MAFTNTKTPKFRKTTPSSELQVLAQKENFSLFIIKGIIGNLTQLKRCATVPQSSVLSVENTLRAIEKKVKLEQKKRKESKNGKA